MNPLKDSESHGAPNTVEGEKDALLSHGLLVSMGKRISAIFDNKNIICVHKKIKNIQHTVQGIVRFTVTLLTLKEKFESQYIVRAGVDFMDAAARVRHKVFCQEKGWEEVQDNALEKDEYDAHSIPVVLIHKGSNEPIACVRLIRADGGDLQVEQFIGPIKTEREESAEVSRLAVISDFRRRKNEQGKVFPEATPDPIRGRFPIITVGVYLALIHTARENNIEYLYFLTKESLVDSLKKLRANPVQIGDSVEHKGIRVNCLISVSEMIANLPWWSKPIWNSVCQQLETK